jgi:spore photoproduct lyase
MRKYTHYFAEKSVKDFPEFEEVARRYPEIEWIDDYQAFCGKNIVQEKSCVVFARKRGAWLKPFYCYENSAYHFLSLDLAEGCLFDCVYCYLQSYLNHGALVIFLDSDGLFRELSALQQNSYWISTGLLSDSLLAESQFSLLDRISKWIPSDSILELRIKAADLGTLRNPEISRNSIVVSWSMNPSKIAQKYEYGACPVDERLRAASEALELGYRIAFHLDPVFHFEGWQEAYGELFERLRDFPKERLAFLSVGLFRYMPDLGNIIRKRFPFHPILSSEFFPDEDGKYHYFREIRKEMYASFAGWVNDWKDVPIFWSMEPDQSLYGSL